MGICNLNFSGSDIRTTTRGKRRWNGKSGPTDFTTSLDVPRQLQQHTQSWWCTKLRDLDLWPVDLQLTSQVTFAAWNHIHHISTFYSFSQYRSVSKLDRINGLIDELEFIHFANAMPRVGPGHPSPPFVHLFPFFHWLYLFSSFAHPFPFYQNSPTPFPGRRS